MTDRAPLLVKLAAGPCAVDLASGQSRTFNIDGGIAQMKSNNLTVLTKKAVSQARNPNDEIAVGRKPE